MSELERRFTAGRVELRLGTDKRTFGGYAAKFERQSKNLGGFVEVITRSFFNKSAGDGWPDVLARYNHDDNMLLGTTASGTLRLSLDDQGLVYEVDPPQARADVFELVQRGDITKSSFAFQTFEDDWSMTDQGFPMRSLVSGRLIDVAPVNVPAYDDTSVGVRCEPAMRSLAKKFDASIDEVKSLAAEDGLRKFFALSGGQAAPKKRSAAAALAIAKAIQPNV